MKIWTVSLSVIGLCLGLIFGWGSDEYFGVNLVDDILVSLVLGIPLLMLGFVLGFM